MSSSTDLISNPIMISPHGDRLIDRWLQGVEHEAALKRAKSLVQISLSPASISDVELIGNGAYSPLTGFMGEADYQTVVKDMRLTNGLVWPLPITLPVDDDRAGQIREGQTVVLTQEDRPLAIMQVDEKFCYDTKWEASQVYQTIDPNHPGVARLYQQGDMLLAGDIWLLNSPESAESDEISKRRYSPEETRKRFKKKGWQRIVGFQTRNPLHRAHESVLQEALKVADGLFLHPLVGETKPDDITAETRLNSYRNLRSFYYEESPVMLGVFPAAMRYAGPREALFHALCRKNYGCTHFIVGRDHAGVGNYYAPGAACDIFKEFLPDELGIEPLFYPEVRYYCRKCREVVVEGDCKHVQNYSRMSGTLVRKMLAEGRMPPAEVMRPEVSWSLIKAAPGKRPVGSLIWLVGNMLIRNRKGLIIAFNEKVWQFRSFCSRKLGSKSKSKTDDPHIT